jgi:hypothetical protein
MASFSKEVSVSQAFELCNRIGRFAGSEARAETVMRRLLGSDDAMLALIRVVTDEERAVDLDADPVCPEGWQVAEHRKGGRLEWSPDKARLFLAEGQRGEGVVGRDLRTAVAGENPFNANLLDWLLAHPEEIPDSWKGKAVFFWGTVYRDRDGNLCVRYLYWVGGRWYWDYYWLDDRWNAGNPALVPAS